MSAKQLARAMSVEVSLRQRQNAVEVHLAGTAQPEMLNRLGLALAAAAAGQETLIVNLDDLSLLSAEHVRALTRALNQVDGVRLCLVCARPTARLLVRRSRPSTAIFPDLDSALASACPSHPPPCSGSRSERFTPGNRWSLGDSPTTP